MSRLAVITGASSGIGAAFANALAARGHDLVISARRERRLERLAKRVIDQHGVEVEVISADLADVGALEALAAIVTTRRPDVLVNAAGFGTFGPLAAVDPHRQQMLVAVQLAAPIRLIQAALPSMVARENGGIITVASIGALASAPDNATYCATKAGVVALTRSLALELAGSGVAVQAVCPGFTRTEFHASKAYADVQMDRLVPAWLWSSAEEVADVALRALGRHVVVVPRWRDRLLVLALRAGLISFPRAPRYAQQAQT